MTTDIYGRATGLGARFIVVLSDLWGYPTDARVKPPYEDYAAWEDFVRATARASQGRQVIFDIWNEPNAKDFWWGHDTLALERFIETFRRAHNVLRAELGSSAVIAGPGISNLNEAILKKFLMDSKANGVQLDVLTWHEFRGDEALPKMEADLLAARAMYLEALDFAALKIKEIQVQESVGEEGHLRPGSNLAYFYHLERGKADAAARACWNEGSPQSNNCWNNTLEGLLTPVSFEPRAVWWATKAYADSVAGRVTSSTVDPRLIVFASASSDAADRAQVLIGYYGSAPADSPPLATEVAFTRLDSLSFLSGLNAVRVSAWRIPNTGRDGVPSLERIADIQVPIDHFRATVTLPPLRLFEAVLVTLERP